MKLLRNLLINRDFGLLFVGRLVSQIGDGIHYFAMAWLVLDLTGSGAALGTLLIAASMPGILLTPFSGVLADSWDRKTIVVAMDTLRGLLLLLLAFIYATGHLTLPILYASTILLALCGVLFGPAVAATVPGLVKRHELTKANARDTFSHSATGILGPIVGAFILGSTGYLGVFLINGGSFLLSALSEAFIRFPKQKQPTATNTPSSFCNNLLGGFRYLWSNAGLRVIMVGGIILNSLFSPLFGVVFPYFGKEVLLMSPQHFGLSQSAVPVGMLVGTIIVGFLAQKIPRLRLLVGSVSGQGGLTMILGLVALPMVHTQLAGLTMVGAMAIPLFLMGILTVQINVPLNVMMQETVPEHFRGRVFSLFGSTMNAAAPLGMGLAGVLIDIIPIHVFFLFCGGIVALMAFVLGLSPALHQLCAQATPSPQTGTAPKQAAS